LTIFGKISKVTMKRVDFSEEKTYRRKVGEIMGKGSSRESRKGDRRKSDSKHRPRARGLAAPQSPAVSSHIGSPEPVKAKPKSLFAGKAFSRPWQGLVKIKPGRTTWGTANAKARKRYQAAAKAVEMAQKAKMLRITIPQLKFRQAAEVAAIIAEDKRQQSEVMSRARERLRR
jgi:hypothetical protein